MDVAKMKYHEGWTVDLEGADFKLWAPQPRQPTWSASWDIWESDPNDPEKILDNSDRGDWRSGVTPEEALMVLDNHPNPDLATRARRLLLGAAREYDRTESPTEAPS